MVLGYLRMIWSVSGKAENARLGYTSFGRKKPKQNALMPRQKFTVEGLVPLHSPALFLLARVSEGTKLGRGGTRAFHMGRQRAT